MTEEEGPPLYFFGARWDAPMLEDADAREIPTPLGEDCGFCEEPIKSGQQGLMRTFLADVDEKSGQFIPSVKPVHRECDLRQVLGGINHLRGDCRCHGGSSAPDPEWATLREAALLAAAYFEGRLCRRAPTL